MTNCPNPARFRNTESLNRQGLPGHGHSLVYIDLLSVIFSKLYCLGITKINNNNQRPYSSISIVLAIGDDVMKLELGVCPMSMTLHNI